MVNDKMENKELKKGVGYFFGIDTSGFIKRFFTVKDIIMTFAVLSIFYTLFLSNLEFNSNTKIILKESNAQQGAGGLMALVNPSLSNQRQNIKILETFLLSRGMFKKIDEQFNLRKHFVSGDINFYARLSPEDSIERFLDLYRSKLNFIYDSESDIVSIDFYHTDKNAAQNILNFINKELMILINSLNRTTSEKKLEMINEVIKTSMADYKKQKKELEEFQMKYKTISPKDDLLKRVEITVELEKEIERLDNDIKQKSIYMNKDYYEVQDAIKLKVQYEKKLGDKLKSLIGVNKNNVNLIINNFEELKNRLKIQEVVLAETLSRQSSTRIDIQKEKLLLEVLTLPTLGEEHVKPVKIHSVLLIIILSFMFYFIFTVIVTIIKEKKY